MSIAVMKQALEALEQIKGFMFHPAKVFSWEPSIIALRAAIEQAEKPVAHSVVAGVLFDFMGWLTSREKRLTLSSTDEAGPAVEAITEFAKMRGLHLEDAQVEHWQAILTTPPAAPRQWVGLTDEEVNEFYWISALTVEAIEAKLKEKNT
jgi:hypothetical protein